MAHLPDRIQVQVNHTMRRHGAYETEQYHDQLRDLQRVEQLITELTLIAERTGFLVDDYTLIESHAPQGKMGHFPELHLVLVQVPDHLRSMLSERAAVTESSVEFQQEAVGNWRRP